MRSLVKPELKKSENYKNESLIYAYEFTDIVCGGGVCAGGWSSPSSIGWIDSNGNGWVIDQTGSHDIVNGVVK